MKSALLPLLLLLVFLSSCSKDARYNRKMDGTWKVTVSNGETIPNQSYSEKTYTFTKTTRTSGDVSVRVVPIMGNAYEYSGNYTLVDDGRLHIEAADPNGVLIKLEFQLNEVEKTKMKWTVVANGAVEVLEK